MARARTYTDDQLAEAVAISTSWRGVLRTLGLVGTSSGALRSVRTRADLRGYDYGHFTGQRRWTESELRAAVVSASTWSEVTEALGLGSTSAIATVRGHAVRLGLGVEHLRRSSAREPESAPTPDVANLDRAGSVLAAGWFLLCGMSISWPLEPARYDLVVDTPTGLRRVQVKTTTVRTSESWKVYLSTSRQGRTVYDVDEIDDFFVIDGALNYYVIPLAAVGGLHAIHLSAYERFRVAAIPTGSA